MIVLSFKTENFLSTQSHTHTHTTHTLHIDRQKDTRWNNRTTIGDIVWLLLPSRSHSEILLFIRRANPNYANSEVFGNKKRRITFCTQNVSEFMTLQNKLKTNIVNLCFCFVSRK